MNTRQNPNPAVIARSSTVEIEPAKPAVFVRRVVLDLSADQAANLMAVLGAAPSGPTSPIYEALYDEGVVANDAATELVTKFYERRYGKLDF